MADAAAAPGLGHLDGGQLDVEELGEELGGHEVGLAVPLHVGHEVGVVGGVVHRRTEHQLVADRRRVGVALHRLEVDLGARQLLVAGVELPHVAEGDDRVAHAPHGEVHHRVADVAALEVEHGDQVVAVVVELAGVAEDRLGPAAVVGLEPVHPGEAELHERIGPVLGRPPLLLLDLHRHLAGAVLRDGDAGGDERLDGQLVHRHHRLQVLVDDAVAIDVVDPGEVGPAGHALEEDGVELVAPPVDVGHGHAVLLEERVEGELVAEREAEGVAPVAPHDDVERRPVALAAHEPRRPPPHLPPDLVHGHPELPLERRRDLVERGDHR